ncbi:hypothetical protein [Gemmatimonas sp.]|uniref:hypothetical protein n=1 Tax=Gemmatimonas sp. TaxID=1962908 RepID=UPI002636F8B0|nr:hypothetical protein [Gemmatimonas sp.]
MVVLDELEFLMAMEDDRVSYLVAVWDRVSRGRSRKLVLRGSEVDTKGIRALATYRALLAAVAGGKAQLEERAHSTGPGDRGSAARGIAKLE